MPDEPIEEPVSLIIETKGAADANSYATVEEAEAFFATLYGAEEWSSMVTTAKEQLLIAATVAIDDIPLRYEKLDETQSLNFPVNNASSTDDGFSRAKRSVFWQAFYLMKNFDSIEEARSNKIQGMRQEVISKIQKTTTGYNPFANYHPQVLKILSSFSDYNFIIRRG